MSASPPPHFLMRHTKRSDCISGGNAKTERLITKTRGSFHLSWTLRSRSKAFSQGTNWNFSSPTFLLVFKPHEALFPACGLFLAPVKRNLSCYDPTEPGFIEKEIAMAYRPFPNKFGKALALKHTRLCAHTHTHKHTVITKLPTDL